MAPGDVCLCINLSWMDVLANFNCHHDITRNCREKSHNEKSSRFRLAYEPSLDS